MLWCGFVEGVDDLRQEVYRSIDDEAELVHDFVDDWTRVMQAERFDLN